MENSINEIINLVNNWQTLGTIAGVIVLLQLLMKALKLKFINDVFTKYKIKWVKPYVAIALGATAGALGAYSSNSSVTNGLVAGIITGLASIGWNEATNKLKSSKREK